MITTLYSLLFGDNYIEDDFKSGNTLKSGHYKRTIPGTSLQVWNEPVSMLTPIGIDTSKANYGCLMTVNQNRTIYYLGENPRNAVLLKGRFGGHTIAVDDMCAWATKIKDSSAEQPFGSQYDEIKEFLVKNLHSLEANTQFEVAKTVTDIMTEEPEADTAVPIAQEAEIKIPLFMRRPVAPRTSSRQVFDWAKDDEELARASAPAKPATAGLNSGDPEFDALVASVNLGEFHPTQEADYDEDDYDEYDEDEDDEPGFSHGLKQMFSGR